MAIPTRVNGPGTFFVTSVTWERRRIFQVEANARMFLDKLEAYRENYLLHAYVVMPDHVHLLLTPGRLTLEPQGLKPHPEAGVGGTAEAVPFQKDRKGFARWEAGQAPDFNDYAAWLDGGQA